MSDVLAQGKGRSLAEMGETAQSTRRDFLYVATAAVGAFGAVAAAVPLIDQMNPDAATLAAGAPVDVDLSRLQPGQQVAVRWRERPIFILNRPANVLQSLQDAKLIGELADPQSAQLQQPPYARNWHRSIKPEDRKSTRLNSSH